MWWKFNIYDSYFKIVTLCIYFEQRFVMGNSLQKKPAARQVVEPPPPDEEFSDEENDENGNLIR